MCFRQKQFVLLYFLALFSYFVVRKQTSHNGRRGKFRGIALINICFYGIINVDLSSPGWRYQYVNRTKIHTRENNR